MEVKDLLKKFNEYSLEGSKEILTAYKYAEK